MSTSRSRGLPHLREHMAELTLRVPDDRFDATLGTIAGIGALASRSITTIDLADKLIDATARLRNLRREERDLRAIMDRSGKMLEARPNRRCVACGSPGSPVL